MPVNRQYVQTHQGMIRTNLRCLWARLCASGRPRWVGVNGCQTARREHKVSQAGKQKLQPQSLSFSTQTHTHTHTSVTHPFWHWTALGPVLTQLSSVQTSGQVVTQYRRTLGTLSDPKTSDLELLPPSDFARVWWGPGQEISFHLPHRQAKASFHTNTVKGKSLGFDSQVLHCFGLFS